MSRAGGTVCAKMQKCRWMKEQCPLRNQQAEGKVKENLKVDAILWGAYPPKGLGWSWP